VALPGAAPGAELVRCGEAGADDPGTAAESGGGSVPGAATVEEAEVTVVEDDGRSTDVEVGRRALWSSAFACVPTYTAVPPASAATTPATSAARESRARPRRLRAARRACLAPTDGTAPVAIRVGSSVTDARDSSVASSSVGTGSCSSVSKVGAGRSKSPPSSSPLSGGLSAHASSGDSSAHSSTGSPSASCPRKKPRAVGAFSSLASPSAPSAGGHSGWSPSGARAQSSATGMRGSVPGSFALKATDRAIPAPPRHPRRYRAPP